jgi:hypothetical protein
MTCSYRVRTDWLSSRRAPHPFPKPSGARPGSPPLSGHFLARLVPIIPESLFITVRTHAHCCSRAAFARRAWANNPSHSGSPTANAAPPGLVRRAFAGARSRLCGRDLDAPGAPSKDATRQCGPPRVAIATRYECASFVLREYEPYQSVHA